MSGDAGMTDGAPESGQVSDRQRVLARDARILIDCGLRIVPVGKDKSPNVSSWRHLPDPEHVHSQDEIRAWIADPRTLGWAVFSGRCSGGLLTLDVEAAGMVEPSITDAFHNGALSGRCQRRSPHGGRHGFVRITDVAVDGNPGDWHGEVLAKRRSSTGDAVLLAEVRGERQYTVVTGPGRPLLDADFVPHRMTRAEWDRMLAPMRDLHDPSTDRKLRVLQGGKSGGADRGTGGVKLHDTGAVLRQAVLEHPELWVKLLDPGWQVLGMYPGIEDGTSRVTLHRPDYGKPAASGAESANADGAVLMVFSESVPWLPDRAKLGLSALDAVACAWFDGDYAKAQQQAEEVARMLVEDGVAVAPGDPFAEWPTWLLEQVHAAHMAWLASSGTLPGAVGPLPEDAPPETGSAQESRGEESQPQVEGLTVTTETAAEREQRIANDRALERLRADRHAREVLEAEAMAAVTGERVIMGMAAAMARPKVHALIDRVLAAEVNILAGPSEAGKSLLARDWALALATGTAWRGHAVSLARPVLWIASEGTHDLDERWGTHPLWDAALDDRVRLLDMPVNLTVRAEVDWLMDAAADLRPGLVVFDVIYGMGLADDNTSKDASPVIAAMKRISAEWDCATLALGHPGHNSSERRMRGTSMWRQLAYTDWFLGDGLLTCEKSKLTNKAALSAGYAVDYPSLRWLSLAQSLAGAPRTREEQVHDDIASFPGESVRARAKRLAPVFGVSENRARAIIQKVITEDGDEDGI